MLLSARMSLQLFLILIYFGLELNAKLPGLVLKERTDLALYPEDYYGIMSTGRLRKPYLKKLGFNIFGNKRNESVVFPADYLYREYIFETTKSRKGMKQASKKKKRPKQDQKRLETQTAEETEPSSEEPTRSQSELKTTRSRSTTGQKEYVWDNWPIITLSQRPTLGSTRKTQTLPSHFPFAPVTEKTRLWREVEWSRGPTGHDDIYYNFYKDYYVSDQVGKLNTYTGTPPKCHQQAYRVDGQVVNAPVREELYDEIFLDYLKDRVQSYSTWSAFVKANPCFTRLYKFYGTTKILALFAARPLMRVKDPKEKTPIELYRKDYVVLTEPIPKTTTTHIMALFMKTRPTIMMTRHKDMTYGTTYTVHDTTTTDDSINEDDIIRELMASDDMTRTKPVPTRTRSRIMYEFLGSLRTRLYGIKKSHTIRKNLVTPEIWSTETDDQSTPEESTTGIEDTTHTTEEECLNKRQGKKYLKHVERFAKQSYDARKPPTHLSSIICYNCNQWHGSDLMEQNSPNCHQIFEGRDETYRGYALRRAYKCVYDQQNTYQIGQKHGGPQYRVGCTYRFLDVPSIYDDRYCRKWPPDSSNYNYATKRMNRLEKLLRFTENGCVASPMASLTPFARGISLWVRYHVCVCNTDYCNVGETLRLDLSVSYAVLVVFFKNVIVFGV